MNIISSIVIPYNDVDIFGDFSICRFVMLVLMFVCSFNVFNF